MNIILLAFDGLDYRDVVEEERFCLNEFRDFEHTRKIDLEQRPFYFTSELFTDLITSTAKEEHGIEGLKKYTEGRFGLSPHGFEKWLQRNLTPLFVQGIKFGGFEVKGREVPEIRFFTRNFRHGMYQALLDSHYVKYERCDIETPTIFDEFENAHQQQTPVYDWRKADVFHHLKGDGDEAELVERCREHIEDEFEKSKRKFWSSENGVNSIDWSSDEPQFYFHHFHYIDWLQHLYRNGDFDQGIEQLSSPWFKVNEFLADVKEYVDGLEDTEVVVMSDHGIPAEILGHYPQAFISYDKEIFPKNVITLKNIGNSIRGVLNGREHPQTVRVIDSHRDEPVENGNASAKASFL